MQFTFFLLRDLHPKKAVQKAYIKKKAHNLRQNIKMNAANIFLVKDLDPLAWPLDFFFGGGLRTPTLRRGPCSWGYGLRRSGVVPRVGAKDSHTPTGLEIKLSGTFL